MLSAALIVRDEAEHLAGCLKSIQAIVDEIVVVDTGSTDESVEIAREHGARTYPYEWQGNFANARNVALERARGDWVLSIDADERLRPHDRRALNRRLANQRVVGYHVLFHPQPGWTAYRELRLFRRARGIRYEGIIHENPWPSIHRWIGERGGEIGDSGLVMDHLGHQRDRTAKHARDLPLLQRALAEDPDDVYCWLHLGRIHAARGELPSAREAWWSGVAAVRRRGVRRVSDCLPHLELIQATLDDERAAGIRQAEAEALLAEATATFPENASLVWSTGRMRLRQGRIAEAIAAFERLRDWPARGDAGLAHDRRLFTVEAHAALGYCHFRSKRFADAEHHFSRALALDPTDRGNRLRRDLCRHLLERERRPSTR